MKKNISTQEATISSNFQSLDWPTICKEIEAKLGKEIYESWIKKLKLVEEFQHYLVLSSPTRFIRDWVVSRYIDKILEVIKLYKKTVSRIDFIIESELSVNSNNVSDQDPKFIKESNGEEIKVKILNINKEVLEKSIKPFNKNEGTSNKKKWDIGATYFDREVDPFVDSLINRYNVPLKSIKENVR